MKIMLCSLLITVCFWSCSVNQTYLNVGNKDTPKVEPTQPAANTYQANYSVEKPDENNNSVANVNNENKSSNNQSKGDLKINVYENSQLTSTYIYSKNIFQKIIYPDSENNDSELEDNPGLNEFVEKTLETSRNNYKALKAKKIKISFPELIFTEIDNIATMLDSTEFYSNFKKADIRANDERIIRFNNFNHKVRFYPSDNGIPEDALITNYELTLKNGYLNKEVYQYKNKGTEADSLIREYIYDGDKLIKVVATNTYVVDGKTNKDVTEKRFEYQTENKKLSNG